MKAMILAAGRGERMRPLTDHTPKPLLPIAGKPLLQYTLEKLAKAGFNDIIINLAYLGHQIKDYFGNGHHYGVNIQYSDEGEQALETAGGIAHALPLLGDETFLVVNGDIASDFPLAQLHHQAVDLAHLVMVNNPDHHPEGDFHLQSNGQLSEEGPYKLTFSGIGLYHPDLFHHLPQGPHKLGPLLRQHMQQGHISASYYDGFWMDIGTLDRLQQLEKFYQQQ